MVKHGQSLNLRTSDGGCLDTQIFAERTLASEHWTEKKGLKESSRKVGGGVFKSELYRPGNPKLLCISDLLVVSQDKRQEREAGTWRK